MIPFCTHGGGGEQSCFRDFVKNTSKATNKKGFITSGGAASSARPQVEKWLKEIDIIKLYKEFENTIIEGLKINRGEIKQ